MIDKFKTNKAFNYRCESVANENPDFSQCILKYNNSKPTIAIWGDSHAAALSYGLIENFEDKYNIYLRWTSGCPPVFNGTEEIKNACKRNNNYIIEELNKIRPRYVVLHAAWFARGYYKDSFKLLEETVNKIREIGIKNIIIVGPVPHFDSELPKLMIKEYIDKGSIPRRINFINQDKYFEMDQAINKLSKKWNVKYISLANFLCNTNGCLTMFNNNVNNVLMFDHDHLTGIGSQYLVKQLKNILEFQ